MDEADFAQANQEAWDRRVLALQLAAMPQGESAEECEECGGLIPEKRREAAPGCTRCVRCQKLFELKTRGR